jgi:hypothetical protein
LYINIEGSVAVFSSTSQKKQGLFWPKLSVELVLVTELETSKGRIFDKSLLPELLNHLTDVLV